jgi:hypothetical protein
LFRNHIPATKQKSILGYAGTRGLVAWYLSTKLYVVIPEGRNHDSHLREDLNLKDTVVSIYQDAHKNYFQISIFFILIF